MKNPALAWFRAFCLGVVRYATGMLAIASGYYLFLVIVPFFVLGIYKVPYTLVAYSQGPYYYESLGWPAAILAMFMFACKGLIPWLWALTAVNFGVSRKWWVLAILVLSPLPIAYINGGPYAHHIDGWVVLG